MSLTKIELGTLMAILVVACGSVPNFAFAATLYQQSISTTVTESASTAYGQKLGTGLSGTIGDIAVYLAKRPGSPDAYLDFRLYCYTDSGYTTKCAGTNNGHVARNQDYNTTLTATTKTLVTKSIYAYNDTADTFDGSRYAFDPSKYYKLVIGAPVNFQIYGSSSNVYAGGDCINDNGGGTNTCGTSPVVADLHFIIMSAAGYVNEGIIAINNPTYAEVISSANNVLFDFNYYVNTLNYDKAGFALVDNTAQQNINVSTLEEDINASGLSNFSGFFDLIHGHVYSWTPYLRNSSTDVYTYGSTTPFFAGAKTNQSIPDSPTPTWNGCTNILCPGAIFSTSTGILTWNGGTTTSPFGPFGETLDSLIASKAPFSYLYDIKQVLFELGNGSTTSIYAQSCSNNDAYYTLPTGVLGTTLSNGSTSVKFIDACAIKSYPIVQEIRRAISYALYLITGIGLTGMALSII